MSDLKQCPFMSEIVLHDNQLWMPCDEDFITKTVEEVTFDTHEVDDKIYYPLIHLASTKWFSQAQIEAFGQWLGENELEGLEGLSPVRWFGPKERPKLMIGFSPEGDAFVYGGVIHFPEGEGRFSFPVTGINFMGESFVCLQDIAKFGLESNDIMIELVGDVAERLGIKCKSFS